MTSDDEREQLILQHLPQVRLIARRIQERLPENISLEDLVSTLSLIHILALRIRQKAIENQVPIIENPPLAQALYKSVEVGQEIPPHLYRAVAEILAYIFKLMHGRLPG